MNSYLITGGNSEERLKKAKEIITSYQLPVTSYQNNPDILLIEPILSIGINQIRQLQRFLSRKPYQAAIKAAIILEAEKLTLAAQNAFLKTLEEPPAHSVIILCSQSKENLLPTIISRCQIAQLPATSYQLPATKLTSHFSLLNQLINSRVGKRLKLIEPYTKSRKDAINFCQEMMLGLRHLLKETASNKSKKKLPITNNQLLITISNFQHTLNLLNSNINVKLSLDNLVLSLPSVRLDSGLRSC